MSSSLELLDRFERSELGITAHHHMRAELGAHVLGFDTGAGASMPDCAEVEPVVLALLEPAPGRLVGCIQLDRLPDYIDTAAVLELEAIACGFTRCCWQATEALACGTFSLTRTSGELWLVHTHAQLYRPQHYYQAQEAPDHA